MDVVLLHALPLDHRMWEPQLPALAGHDVHAPDLYELGSSMEEWARAVLDLLDGPFVAVGASMGGYCALQAARLAPDRVRGVVLSGSRPEADPPERRPTREEWIRRAREEGAAGLWDAMGATAYATVTEPARERARALALEQDGAGLARAVEAIRDRPDGSDVVARLNGPFVLVVGGADPLVAADAAASIVAGARNGRLVVFEGVGHLPSLERPQEFNAVLADTLEELAA